MPLFNVTVREHAYTGRFYNDIVTAESFEEALQLAAERATTPQPPPDSKPRQGIDVVVREHAYPRRFYDDIVSGRIPRRGTATGRRAGHHAPAAA